MAVGLDSPIEVASALATLIAAVGTIWISKRRTDAERAMKREELAANAEQREDKELDELQARYERIIEEKSVLLASVARLEERLSAVQRERDRAQEELGCVREDMRELGDRRTRQEPRAPKRRRSDENDPG